jgi:hypothetical protein
VFSVHLLFASDCSGLRHGAVELIAAVMRADNIFVVMVIYCVLQKFTRPFGDPRAPVGFFGSCNAIIIDLHKSVQFSTVLRYLVCSLFVILEADGRSCTHCISILLIPCYLLV